MRSPCLKDLPQPLPIKKGWPWGVEIEEFPVKMPDKSPWPKISIITPSYNQGEFIEETIRSVLLQGYPNLEYIIIDGDSKDNSCEVIQRYERYLAYWTHEPDRGQSEAVNKGFARATGDIIAWINSDDLYLPDTFKKAAETMLHKGKIIRSIIYGDCLVIDENGNSRDIGVAQPVTPKRLIKFWQRNWFIPQPTVFFARYVIDNFKLDETLHYVMDWEFYLRLLKEHEFYNTKEVLAKFRFCQGTKSFEKKGLFWEEHLRISRRYWDNRLMALQYWIEYKTWPAFYTIKTICSLIFRKILRHILGNNLYEKLRLKKRKAFPRQ